MLLTRFMKEAGFKVLALSKLSSSEYSIALYLINCAASGMESIITTYSEFASLLGYDEKTIKESLSILKNKEMLRIKDSEAHSIKLNFEFDTHHWKLTATENLTPRDALIFPFMSKRHNKKTFLKESENTQEPWETILSEYKSVQDSNNLDLTIETKAAHLLADTHPMSEVLIIIHHFGKRIKSLNLLASSWHHYQDLYENEVHQVDFEDARKKHKLLDEQLRQFAKEELKKSNENMLTEEEISVLKVIVFHQHPRRQLYWAYQLHERYPNLHSFFIDNANLMLSVTNDGTIIKKGRPDTKKDK